MTHSFAQFFTALVGDICFHSNKFEANKFCQDKFAYEIVLEIIDALWEVSAIVNKPNLSDFYMESTLIIYGLCLQK